jgi:GNAT superfamily N-acetyltransferase
MTTNHHTVMSRACAYLRANMNRDGKAIRIPPFTITFDDASADLFRNYALPHDGAAPGPAEVAALVACFEQNGRVPRLEYVPELAPLVLDALHHAGFQIERSLPLMTCSDDKLMQPPRIDDLEWHIVTRSSALEVAARLQNESYGVTETTTADIQRLQDIVDLGGAVALVCSTRTGQPLGSGLYTPPQEGVTEIAAIGVRETARRQGIGGGIASLLARHALERGIHFPFLMGAEENANVYRRAGFADFGTMMHISR